MTNVIAIGECAGYSITLHVGEGQFVASMDGQEYVMSSYDLNDLRTRVRTLAERERQAARLQQVPVKVWVYCRHNGVPGFLDCVDVVGILAGGQTYSPIVLRTIQGQVEPVDQPMVVFHPDDVRVSHLKALLKNKRELLEKFNAVDRDITLYCSKSPHIEVPLARTKERVFDVEPGFLQALRDIRCEESEGT